VERFRVSSIARWADNFTRRRLMTFLRTMMKQAAASRRRFFRTCKHILDDGDSVGNGVYNLPGIGESYCLMSGGGWTLLDAFGSGDNFGLGPGITTNEGFDAVGWVRSKGLSSVAVNYVQFYDTLTFTRPLPDWGSSFRFHHGVHRTISYRSASSRVLIDGVLIGSVSNSTTTTTGEYQRGSILTWTIVGGGCYPRIFSLFVM
jgi:hypothetical protein